MKLPAWFRSRAYDLSPYGVTLIKDMSQAPRRQLPPLSSLLPATEDLAAVLNQFSMNSKEYAEAMLRLRQCLQNMETQMNPSLQELNLAEVRTCIEAAIACQLPIYLHGMPGIGKSEVVAQVTGSLEARMVDIRAALLDPVDVRGMPGVIKGKSVWHTPAIWPTVNMVGDEKVVMFFDELSAAPQSVQNALLQITLDRTVNDEPLGPNVAIVLAGNRVQDRTGSHRLSAALANRLLHVEVKADVDTWTQFALDQQYRPELVAFVRFRPALLCDAETSADSPAYPTPRAWSFVNKLMGNTSVASDSATRMALVSGAVGMAAAIEFTSFLEVFSQLPSLGDIAKNPDTTPVPSEPGALYALATALAAKADAKVANAYMQYATRWPVEFAVLFAKDLIERDQSLATGKTFVEFFTRNSTLFQTA